MTKRITRTQSVSRREALHLLGAAGAAAVVGWEKDGQHRLDQYQVEGEKKLRNKRK